ncbi:MULTISPECIES: hypothetical protein [unclassified Oceanispirochaeta]|uniref:hypothetical protein n=1 Tax=unclassified Oceanispirochaeta TaxID=2635722 RepID=UPI000E092CCB|nr:MULTISPECIES: hypothetical protein [unclassified Oceanispirochaeta]MBF9015708.1 hypothetical protein [Oceanispirochaeta sp. M2]NPD72173.1 hypothetical protein [Oceanispirochaeta sp. M1]RDG32272.1 hypothetical protein DV872_08685 [Oceanispirochaeta sp. M1]
MFKRFNMGNSLLQRVLLSLLIFSGITAPLTAQPTWSGDAAVDASEFVNFVDDVPLAGASSSFTRNTVILVTNPQNNKTVEVTIVKRAPRPGVFLVLSEDAGKALSLSSGQVISVQVQVAESGIRSEYDEFKSVDPDINPGVTVPDEEVLETVVSDKTVPEEAIPEAGEDFTTAPGLSYDEPVPVPIPGDNLRVDRGSPEAEIHEDIILEEVIPVAAMEESDDVPAFAPVEEDIPVLSPETLAGAPEETLDLSAVEELSDTILPAGDNVIYFLTPSDFRPPTQPIVSKEESDEIVPVLVDRETLEDYIVSQLNNGSSYIQLGAYSTAESIYSEIEAIEARYPMIVWTEQKNGLSLYKLLIGPLTRDETGVLSYRFRDSGYTDLFLYKP